MKWNGSIYYNVISQDNVGVDRVALELSPCPVFPPHYWQRPWMRGAEGMQARMGNARDRDLPISCPPTHPKPSLPRVTEDGAGSQTQFLGIEEREGGFALKKFQRFCPLMQTPPAEATTSTHPALRWKPTRSASPFPHLHPCFPTSPSLDLFASFLERPRLRRTGKCQGADAPGNINELQNPRINSTQSFCFSSHAHLPAAGLSSQAAK